MKYSVATGELPRTLHWFKWEAYATWLTGFALLVLVYYLGAASFLVDPQVARLSPGAAVAAGVTTLIVSRLVCHGLRRPALGGPALPPPAGPFAVPPAAPGGLTRRLGPRASDLH